jgi:hypothetical protein
MTLYYKFLVLEEHPNGRQMLQGGLEPASPPA